MIGLVRSPIPCVSLFVVRHVFRSRLTMSKPQVVFVLGAPGSGKGTQCEKICKEFDYIHLSAGELLREEMNNRSSEHIELIDRCIKRGSIVPVEVTVSLLQQAMKRKPTVANDDGAGDAPVSGKFLIDGFPRNQDNLSGWTRLAANETQLNFVLFFDCPEEICTQRCLERGACGSGRTDDNEDSLRKRFRTYIGHTLPIVKHFEAMNLVHKIDAARTPDEIYADVRKIFQVSG